MRKWLVALALMPAAIGCSCDPGTVDVNNEVSPPEVYLDFGNVFIGETSQKSFEIKGNGRTDTTLAIESGIELPADYVMTPKTAPVGAGRPATFTVDFNPVEPPGARNFDFYINAPNSQPGQIHVILHGIATKRQIQTNPADCLDFGTVMLGLEKTLPMEVSNLVSADLSIGVKVLDSAFSVDPTHLDLGPRGVAPVNVRFFPPARGPYETDLIFDLCEKCEPAVAPVRRCLKGFAAVEKFEITPSPLAFGTHSPDTTTCKDLTVTNKGDVSIYTRDVRLDDGLKRVPGSFELKLGDILNNKEIKPEESASFQLCFTPKKLGQEYSGNVQVYTDNQVQKVAVTGRGGAAKIVAIPDHIDYGITTPGRVLARRTVLTNVGEPTDVMVTKVEYTPQDGSLNVETPEVPFNVGSDGDFPMDVTFAGTAPGDYAGEIKITVHNVDANTDDVIVIPITAQVLAGEPCNLIIRPIEVNFGFVHAGKNPETNEQEVYTKDVRIRNAGTDECYVWDFALEPSPPASDKFELVGAPPGIQAIPVGEDLVVTVKFTPVDPSIQPEESHLLFKKMTVATEDPQVSIPVKAFGSALCLKVEPDPVEFGKIPFGYVPVQSFNLTNCGSSLIKIGGNDPKQPPAPDWNGDIAFSAFSSPEFSIARETIPKRMPFTLPAGNLLSLAVIYDPTGIGPDQGQLQIWLKNAAAPIIVDVFGEAVDEPCGDLCNAPQAICPAAQTTWVNAAVSLSGFAKDGLDGENPPDNPDLTCAWTIENGPLTSTALPAEPTKCRTTFRPDVEGDYTFKLTVTDSDGYTDSCLAQVRANIFLGLWIETTWSAPDDIDLHLFHPEAGDILNSATWFNLPYDCYYSNMNPYWDTLSRVDDPHLDRDDEVSTGPENIRIDVPSTQHTYEIGVHWFASRNRNTEQVIVTKVYCGGELARTVSKTLQRQYQAADVATVQWFPDNSCKVTPQPFRLTVIP